MKDELPKPGEVLLTSPLSTQQLACGNREPVENPITVRVARWCVHGIPEHRLCTACPVWRRLWDY